MAAVREIQALQAPHIAEPDDAAMSRMEERMAAAESVARAGRGDSPTLVPPASRQRLVRATQTWTGSSRSTHRSLRCRAGTPTCVSLALSLNQKAKLITACDESLHALSDALAKRGFTGTR